MPMSLRPVDAREYGTKVEIKNLNSFRNVQRALEYEVVRQTKALGRGRNCSRKRARGIPLTASLASMRSKEFAHDYRYFPEPDLVPLATTNEWIIEAIRRTLPELPDTRMQRLVAEYGIPAYDAGVLTSSKTLADYYEACIKRYPKPKVVSNWMMVELLRAPSTAMASRSSNRVLPLESLAELLELVDDGTISGTMAKAVFDSMYETGRLPPKSSRRRDCGRSATRTPWLLPLSRCSLTIQKRSVSSGLPEKKLLRVSSWAR